MSRPICRESCMRACCGGGNCRPSLRIAKLSNCQSMWHSASSASPASQRAVFHENGHTGSSHRVTLVSARSLVNVLVIFCSLWFDLRPRSRTAGPIRGTSVEAHHRFLCGAVGAVTQTGADHHEAARSSARDTAVSCVMTSLQLRHCSIIAKTSRVVLAHDADDAGRPRPLCRDLIV